MLFFWGSKLHFYKAVKLHLRHKQHEPHMLFWQAGLLLQSNTDHSEVFLSLCCPIMHRSDTTAFKSKLWCSSPGGSRASVPIRTPPQSSYPTFQNRQQAHALKSFSFIQQCSTLGTKVRFVVVTRDSAILRDLKETEHTFQQVDFSSCRKQAQWTTKTH